MRKYALFSLKISNNHFTKILSQAILPKLFYNAAIWGHKAKSKANLRKISTLINSAARIATNLPRTTPLQIIYQLTNIPSTKILLEREIVLRLNTLLMQPHKKTHNLLRLHTPLASFSNSLIKSYRLHHDPTPKEILQTPHPSKLYNVHIKTHFDHFKNVQPQDIIIFTDGSAQHHGSGAGYTSFKGDESEPFSAIYIALPKETTNYAAEVVAISEAIQWTLKHQKGDQPNPPAPNTTYHIYTDSISSLYSMRNPLKSNASDYLIACIHMIASSSHNIQMKYIPAHKGYKGNEIADSLAKEGADNSHTLESIEPITDLRNQNKQKIKTLSAATNLQEWTTFAKNNKMFNTTFPTMDLWTAYKSLSTQCKKIHNLIMESIPIGTYLLKIGATNTNICQSCNVPDTLQHYLQHCQSFQQQREKFLVPLNKPISKLHLLRGDAATIAATENFLMSTLYSKSSVT